MENQIIKQNKKDIAKVLPYNIGLALSGGGAKGFAHLGALQALEENGIKPDIISGRGHCGSFLFMWLQT